MLLDELGLSAASDSVKLIHAWDDALGPFAAHCRPEGLRAGVVQARVRDSAWMQRRTMPQILYCGSLKS